MSTLRSSWLVGPSHKAVLGLLASALFILWLGEYTNTDLLLANWFFDPQSRTFPWRYNWLASTFLHYWVKKALVAFGFLLMAVVVVDAVKHLPGISARRRVRLRVVAWSALFIPLVISTIKSHSVLACPWDLQRYGGDAPYLRLLDAVPPGLQAGHCFPAGHASAGLWLAAFAVFWLPEQPAKAMRVFLAGLGVGILMGIVQQVRGAHFLTHTLWSVWIAIAILLIICRCYAKQLQHTA
ncbi:MAG TPA: phosphatase PAP2 family protein [Methylophilaceae bacterium]|nr:phosphatase PAP2 family protein [Methylophilaceae bacterium]